MSSPYVGQIFMFAGNFAPAGWMFCAGQLIPISENETLFNLIGTTYGGDGQETFALPDMRGRVPIHQGTGGGLSTYTLAQTGGTEDVTLTTQQIPSHNHLFLANGNAATSANPSSNATLANQNVSQSPNPVSYYAPYDGTAQVTMPGNSIANSGGNQPHNNIQPIMTLNYCISLFGVFPTQ
jgi:microcystin-dependent protein